MREKDSTSGVERARRRVTEEHVVVDLDVRWGDVVLPDIRVLRVVSPKDGL